MSRWIGVALLGWSDGELTDFYPEDLPEEWRLTWLSNLAMAVVIPPEQWLSVSGDQVQAWIEQTQENFWFYLWCDDERQLQQAETLAGHFSQQFAGVIADFVPTHSADKREILSIGHSALLYPDTSLREGQKRIRAWLDDFHDDHGLIVLTGKARLQVKEVQSLLALLGVGNA